MTLKLVVKWPNAAIDSMEAYLAHPSFDESKYVLEASHWDLILCALSSWTQSMEESNFLAVFKIDEKAKKVTPKMHANDIPALTGSI